MYLKTAQVAEQLGIGYGSVGTLRAAGILIDHNSGVGGNGHRKPAKFDPAEVRSLKKLKLERYGRIFKSHIAEIKGALANGHVPAAPAHAQSGKKAPKTGPTAPSPSAEGIRTQLNRIEHQLNELVRMWR